MHHSKSPEHSSATNELSLKSMAQSSPISEPTVKKDKHIRQNSSGHQKTSVDHLIRQTSDKTSNSDRHKIKLGVCAMEKKTSCKPMQEILNRIAATDDILVLIFPEMMTLYSPIQVFRLLLSTDSASIGMACRGLPDHILLDRFPTN